MAFGSTVWFTVPPSQIWQDECSVIIYSPFKTPHYFLLLPWNTKGNVADFILYKEMETGLETEVTEVFGKLSLKKEQSICLS